MASRQTPCVAAHRTGRPVAAAIAIAVLCVVVAGCAGGKMTPLRDAAAFKKAIQSDKPVLVDFYKGGCPTCILLDAKMDTLAEEYNGRVIVAKFMLMQPYFAVTSPELMDTYRLFYFPTAILFVNGRETWRFHSDYDLAHYRKAMNEALGTPTTPREALGSRKPSGRNNQPGSIARQ